MKKLFLRYELKYLFFCFKRFYPLLKETYCKVKRPLTEPIQFQICTQQLVKDAVAIEVAAEVTAKTIRPYILESMIGSSRQERQILLNKVRSSQTKNIFNRDFRTLPSRMIKEIDELFNNSNLTSMFKGVIEEQYLEVYAIILEYKQYKQLRYKICTCTHKLETLKRVEKDFLGRFEKLAEHRHLVFCYLFQRTFYDKLKVYIATYDNNDEFFDRFHR